MPAVTDAIATSLPGTLRSRLRLARCAPRAGAAKILLVCTLGESIQAKCFSCLGRLHGILHIWHERKPLADIDKPRDTLRSQAATPSPTDSVESTPDRSPREERGGRLGLAALLVVIAGFSIHLFYWFHRKPIKLVQLLSGDGLRASDWRSFARNGMGFVIGVAALWVLLSYLAARKRRWQLRPVLLRGSKAFIPCLAFAPLSLIHYWPALEGTASFLAHALVTAVFIVALTHVYDVDPWGPLDGRTRLRRAGFWALVVGALVFLDLTACSLYRFHEFQTGIDDLGLYDQLCWGLVNGHGFLSTIYSLPDDNFFAEHIVPTVAVFAQLYRIWTDPRLLLLLQAAALAGGGWLVYIIARKRTSASYIPLVLAFSYFINALLERGWIDDFHVDALEVFLYLSAYACLLHTERRRALAGYWISVVLLLGCKEDVGLSVAAFGVVIAVAHRRWALGLGTAALGFAWSFVAITQLLPHYAGVGDTGFEANRQLVNYAHLITDNTDVDPSQIRPMDIVLAPILHPVRVTKAVLAAPRVVSMLKVLLPVAFLPLLSPGWLLLLVPAYATTVLSGWYKQAELGTHYGLVFLAPTYIAAVEGWRRLETQFRDRPRRLRSSALVLVCLAILSANEYREFALSRPLKWRRKFRSRIDRKDVLRVGESIQPDASLVVEEALGSHFSARRRVYKYPHCPEGTRFILLNLWKENQAGPGEREATCARLTRWIRAGTYGIRELEGDTLLLQKDYSKGNPEALLAKALSKIRR